MNEKLKSRIKLALTEDIVAKKSTKWDPDSQPNLYQLDIFLRKSGYRLVDVVDAKGIPELLLEAIKEDHLHPDITHQAADNEFLIVVKQYGALVSSDVEEIIKGYQTAVSVVTHLSSLDLSKLEYEREE